VRLSLLLLMALMTLGAVHVRVFGRFKFPVTRVVALPMLVVMVVLMVMVVVLLLPAASPAVVLP
jgi:hypothetical protein